MPFMERQVQYGEWIEVECAGSTCVFPADLVDDPDKHWDDDAEKFDDDYLADVAQYLEEGPKPEGITSIKKITGYGARPSAPGPLGLYPVVGLRDGGKSQRLPRRDLRR